MSHALDVAALRHGAQAARAAVESLDLSSRGAAPRVDLEQAERPPTAPDARAAHDARVRALNARETATLAKLDPAALGDVVGAAETVDGVTRDAVTAAANEAVASETVAVVSNDAVAASDSVAVEAGDAEATGTAARAVAGTVDVVANDVAVESQVVVVESDNVVVESDNVVVESDSVAPSSATVELVDNLPESDDSVAVEVVDDADSAAARPITESVVEVVTNAHVAAPSADAAGAMGAAGSTGTVSESVLEVFAPHDDSSPVLEIVDETHDHPDGPPRVEVFADEDDEQEPAKVD